ENSVAASEDAKRDGDPAALRHNLESAYGLYRGEFMEGSYEAWVDEPRTHYSDQFSRVLNALAKLSVTEKRWNDALKFGNEILKEAPYREALTRLIMKVLAAQSNPSAVKKHYETLETL